MVKKQHEKILGQEDDFSLMQLIYGALRGSELQLPIGEFPLVLEAGWRNTIGNTICSQKILIF